MEVVPRKSPPRKQPGQGCGPRRIDGLALDVRGSAALLGMTEKTVRGMIERKLIPYRRRGGRIIFLRVELEQWLATLDGCTLAQAIENAQIRQGNQL